MGWGKWLIIGFSLAVVVVTGGVFVGYSLLHQELRVSEASSYVLEPGSGLHRVTRDLGERGALQQPAALGLVLRLLPDAGMVKAGEYPLRPGMRFADLLKAMRNGEVMTYAITFPEGWNIHQFRAHLAAEKRLVQQTAALDDAGLMAALGRPGEHPEGRFFPDTYVFPRGLSDLDLLAQALQRMDRVLAEEWAGRAADLPYERPYEALIMASIVEKETGVPEERGEIAGVFVRRLQKGMRLQTDPTVIYGLGPAFGGNLTRRHLRQHTAYNTYVIDGLPPTPIAMPGRGAIHAALHPEDGTALYFVARGDGTHQFSATLAEHVRAVKKYQINQRARDYRSAPPGK